MLGVIDIGFDGFGLGYGGIINLIVFEFDIVFIVVYNELCESYVAIYIRGKFLNTAYSAASFAIVVFDGFVFMMSIIDG